MRWNIVRLHIADVFGERMIRAIRKILEIGLPGVPVPLATEDAASARGFDSHSHSANSRKEINEAEPGRAQVCRPSVSCKETQRRDSDRTGLAPAAFPAVECGQIAAESSRDLL